MTTPTPPEPGIEAQSPDAHGWLPIERAPRNGSKLLAFVPSRKEKVTFAKWHDRTALWGKWYPSVWLCQNGRECEPTHWQPLPEPPVSSSANSSPAAVTKADAGLLPPASATNSGAAS